jgi:hypothetical protein
MASIRSTKVGDTLTIKKTSQIFGFNPQRLHLTSHHANSAYGLASDPSKILQPGANLTVISKGNAETKYRESYVTVTYNQYTFDIMASYLRNFCA